MYRLKSIEKKRRQIDRFIYLFICSKHINNKNGSIFSLVGLKLNSINCCWNFTTLGYEIIKRQQLDYWTSLWIHGSSRDAVFFVLFVCLFVYGSSLLLFYRKEYRNMWFQFRDVVGKSKNDSSLKFKIQPFLNKF